MKNSAKFIFACFMYMLFFCHSTALGCKYTVRDIGFSDLGSSSYKLYFLIENNTPTEIKLLFQRIAYASLLETNVESETINITQQPQHEKSSWFLSQKEKSLPAVLLADSDGQMMHLPLSTESTNRNQSMWRVVESAVASPLRQKIIDIASRAYGVVLLIEGGESGKNDLALASIKHAVKDISQVLTIMPKPIKEGPQIIVLPHSDIQREKVLLWSLGAAVAEDLKEPQVAVLFGRGRRIGPVLKAEQLVAENIFSLLSIIGADCECGLDRSVMLGKMMPLRWEKRVQSELIAHLGFDVENPMIKAEMSQILSIESSSGGGAKASNPLTAYEEGVIHFDNESSTPRVSSNQFRQARSNGSSFLRVGMLTGGGLILLVLLFSGVIYVRSKRKQN